MSDDGLGLFCRAEEEKLRRENAEMRGLMTRWANAPLTGGETDVFQRLMGVSHNYKEGATIRAFLRQEMKQPETA